MNIVKTGKRIGVGTMVAAAILAPTAVHAVDAPYAQAAAIVLKDGSLHFRKNVDSVHKVGTGKYCVRVNPAVGITSKTPLQATPRTGARTVSAFNWKSSTCDNEENTVIVYSFDLNGAASDSDFYLTIP